MDGEETSTNYDLKAIDLLVRGKTDTSLLHALVAALTDRNQELIALLLQRSTDSLATSNIHIAAAICASVKNRPVKE